MSFVKRQRDAEIRKSIRSQNLQFRKALTGDQIQVSSAAYHYIGRKKAKLARSIASLRDDGSGGCSGRIMWRSRWLIWKILCLDRYGLHPAFDAADNECNTRFLLVTTDDEEAETAKLPTRAASPNR